MNTMEKDPSQLARDFLKSKEEKTVAEKVSGISVSEIVDEKANAVKITAKSVPTKSEPVVVKIDRSGVMDFKNQIELGTAAKFLMQIKLAPKHLETVEQVMSAMTLCRQYRLPASALNEIAVIKGKVGVFGHLMTALAQRHPDYGDMKVQYVDEKQDLICLKNKNLNAPVWACVISIKKKSAEDWNEYFFTKEEAKTAGLLGNTTYDKYLKTMLYHRAKANALLTEYASALKGIESAENLIYDNEAREVNPLSELNERLGLTKQEGNIEKDREGTNTVFENAQI